MENQIKRKILNDPVYGFINMPSDYLFEITEHPYFQRLRRISQLGITYLVYPGALHTRFQHSIGTTHLMKTAIDSIRAKGHEITIDEENAVIGAILLHDIGHGPFSHTLEHSIVENISHEDISEIFMEKLNSIFNGKLDLSIKIFKNQYHKKFLHQLVSSQLDMDRLDYLKRDSFFTGVSEGVIASSRIIKMLNIVNDKLVVEAKGIYSIENFLIARRLMYWQVYLHKTVLSAEQLLVKVLIRAKELVSEGKDLFATPALKYFLSHKISIDDFKSKKLVYNNKTTLDLFANLDDNDILTSAKVWEQHDDKILSLLCRCLVNRNLFKIKIQENKFSGDQKNDIKNQIKTKYGLTNKELKYFVVSGNISNYAYSAIDEKINILHKNGKLVDIGKASDMLNVSVLSKKVKKYYFCHLEI